MKARIILALFLVVSCSTLKKSMISGAVLGGVVGGGGGAIFSPDDQSRGKNAYLFGILGAAVGAGIAYLFSEEPKSQIEKSSLLIEPTVPNSQEIPLFDFSPELKGIKPEVNFKPIKKYEVPQEKLPPELEGKVKRQYIIEYEAQARTIELGSRTIQISPFKAWEHAYEKPED